MGGRVKGKDCTKHTTQFLNNGVNIITPMTDTALGCSIMNGEEQERERDDRAYMNGHVQKEIPSFIGVFSHQ